MAKIAKTEQEEPLEKKLWKAAEKKAQLPDLYIPRFGQSVIVDKDNYIYLIGGQTSSTFLKDVWKGRKNSAIPGFLD